LPQNQATASYVFKNYGTTDFVKKDRPPSTEGRGRLGQTTQKELARSDTRNKPLEFCVFRNIRNRLFFIQLLANRAAFYSFAVLRSFCKLLFSCTQEAQLTHNETTAIVFFFKMEAKQSFNIFATINAVILKKNIVAGGTLLSVARIRGIQSNQSNQSNKSFF